MIGWRAEASLRRAHTRAICVLQQGPPMVWGRLTDDLQYIYNRRSQIA